MCEACSRHANSKGCHALAKHAHAHASESMAPPNRFDELGSAGTVYLRGFVFLHRATDRISAKKRVYAQFSANLRACADEE